MAALEAYESYTIRPNVHDQPKSHPSHEFPALLIFVICSVKFMYCILRPSLTPATFSYHLLLLPRWSFKNIGFKLPSVSTWVGVLGLADQLLSPWHNSPSRILSLPLSCFKEEGRGFSNLCMYKKSTHRPEKTISKNKKKSEENCTNLPWKNQSGEKQPAKSPAPWTMGYKARRAQKPCKSHEKFFSWIQLNMWLQSIRND